MASSVTAISSSVVCSDSVPIKHNTPGTQVSPSTHTTAGHNYGGYYLSGSADPSNVAYNLPPKMDVDVAPPISSGSIAKKI